MVNFLKRNKGDKKSLLGRKRFFGKKEDRSDSVDGRRRFSSKKEPEPPTFEAAPPEITLEPVDDSHLNVTILTQESTPPVTPSKSGEEGSISDTISDLSASIVPCLPNNGERGKTESPAEKMISTTQQHAIRGPSPNEGSGTFTDHRGASQITGVTNETNRTVSSGFSLTDMIENACSMPWGNNRDDNATDKDSQGPSWGMAPSADDDEHFRTETGGRSLDYTAGDTLPSVAEESLTLPSTMDDAPATSAPEKKKTAPVQEKPAPAYISEEEEEEYGEGEESEEEEGYELVLDSNSEEYVSKKSKSAVWKRMKISKSKSPTPAIMEDEKEEKYRAAFGADPDQSLNKRSNSFFSRLANNRSKTPDSRMMDESYIEKSTVTEKNPQMINLSEEVLDPEDLVDKEGERAEHENSQKLEAGVNRNVVDDFEAAQTGEEDKSPDESEDKKKEAIDASVSRSRSWNIASALKRSVSGDASKRASSESGTREGVGSPTMGLFNLLSGTPTKKSGKPKPEEPRPPKPVWKAAVDPNTGATYYYHRVTRQTTWTKPPDFDKQRLPKEVGVTQSMSAEKQKRLDEGVEVPNTPGNVTSILRNTSNAGSDSSQRPYTKKQEHIKELLLDMSPPDPASVDKIIDEYRGREDELIDQLNEIVESQPFDEPMKKAGDSDSDGAGEMQKQRSFRLPLSNKSQSLKNRVMTASTNFTGRSNLTGRSNFSGNSKQTLKTGNTTSAVRNSARMYPVISDLSRSSIDRPGSATGRPPLPVKKAEAKEQSPAMATKDPSPLPPEMGRANSWKRQESEKSSPVKVIKAPRNRELLVEEFSSKGGLRAEKYSGKALSRRRRPFREPRKTSSPPQQEPSDKETTDEDASGMEHESFATDSVSGLSASDAGFNTRKDEFDAAARSALDDAIRNRDWELAATVTDEMRGEHNHELSFNDDATPDEWTQSSLDKFISDNDWDAVAKYIASMRDKNSRVDPEVAHPPSNYNEGPARKRFGARSQLQHDLQQNQLDQSSSWDSGTSFGSEFYSTGSSESPLDSPRRSLNDPRKNFAC